MIDKKILVAKTNNKIDSVVPKCDNWINPGVKISNIKKDKEYSKDEILIYKKLQEFLPSLFAYLREINNRKFNKKIA